MSKLNVAYACDNGYIPQTGISIISLFENNTDFDEIQIYLISKDISESNKEIIYNICAKYGRSLKIIEFEEIAYDLNISQIGRHIETIYAKIFFSRISGVDKMLYIDSDTIINGSLKKLWQENLEGFYMGMVETYTGGDAKKSLGLPINSKFFNDGVAIVNVEYCRENKLIEKCIAGIEYYHGNPPVLSEGLLNKVCNGKIKSISPRYNMMAGLHMYLSLSSEYMASKLSYDLNDLRESYIKPIIIHFLSGFYNRPWTDSCSHPLKNDFIKYKIISPWADMPLIHSNLPFKIRFLGRLLKIVGPQKFDFIYKTVNYVNLQR